MRATGLISLLVTACGQQPAPPAANEVSGQTQPTAAAPVETPGADAQAVSISEKSDLYEFEYGWSAEAAPVPQLDARFRKDMAKAKAELISGVTEDRDERAKQGFDFHPYATQLSYETAGQSERLLSLEMSVYGFTGGAHGSTGSGAILWDRKLAKEVALQDLLQAGTSWAAAIRQPFCVLLDREREKRRSEPVKSDDMFGNCPGTKEVTTLLSDTDKNGRFDHITLIADQYVAGPYAEGPYEIALPITARMIERLKPEYAASFEPKPPVS